MSLPPDDVYELFNRWTPDQGEVLANWIRTTPHWGEQFMEYLESAFGVECHKQFVLAVTDEDGTTRYWQASAADLEELVGPELEPMGDWEAAHTERTRLLMDELDLEPATVSGDADIDIRCTLGLDYWSESEERDFRSRVTELTE